MDLRSYKLSGKEVPRDDLIAVVSVIDPLDFAAFCAANRSRIEGDDAFAVAESLLQRTDRAATVEVYSCELLLTFSNPPKQERDCFIFGSDPACDIVIEDQLLNSMHFALGFMGEFVVLDDMSKRGSTVSVGRGDRRTCPRPGRPYRMVIPPGITFRVALFYFELHIQVFKRHGSELAAFAKNRDAFLASRSRDFLAALDTSSRITTEAGTNSAVEVASRGPVASDSAETPKTDPPAMYWFEKKLGEGGFGTVYQVHRLSDFAMFAAKAVRRGNLEKEMKAMRKLRHERIVRFVDWYQELHGDNILVMEYCVEGSLRHILQSKRGRSLAIWETAETLKQVSQGLLYLHERGVTHRDLKPANILVRSTQPWSVAISDFGLAIEDDSWMITECGTLAYMAPEIMNTGETGGYSNAVDIWALGVVGVEMLEGQLPRFGRKEYDQYTQWPYDTAAARAALPEGPRVTLWKRIVKMLAWDPQDRPDAAECIEDLDDVLHALPAESPDNSSGGQDKPTTAILDVSGAEETSESVGISEGTERASEATRQALDAEELMPQAYKTVPSPAPARKVDDRILHTIIQGRIHKR